MSNSAVMPYADTRSVFTPAFYAPYLSAARRALALLCAARLSMPPGAVLAITYRLKTPGSIRRKLIWRGLPVTVQSAATLSDIAGLRVVLLSEADCYRFAAHLQASASARLLTTRDYIAAPKRSGYRSLHLILQITLPQGTEVPLEIQLRTQEMDDWASARHDVVYKPVSRDKAD